MDEIKTGEYFRCKKYGMIGKYLDSFYDDTEFNVNCEPNYTFVYPSKEEFISSVKHSKNVIDLIEVGDYVNGYRVVDIMENMKTGELHLEMTSDYTNPEIGDCTIYNKDIKSILTHEMYEQNCYKAGED